LRQAIDYLRERNLENEHKEYKEFCCPYVEAADDRVAGDAFQTRSKDFSDSTRGAIPCSDFLIGQNEVGECNRGLFVGFLLVFFGM
jgi:hypothetical protein